MKRRLTGTVISDKMDKTRVVEVVRDVIHPLYKKRYRVSKHYYAHDEENRTKAGDRVTIEETRPLSRLKRWRIIQIEAAAQGPSRPVSATE
jgi:small subunit ribosomal protein S17